MGKKEKILKSLYNEKYLKQINIKDLKICKKGST